MDAITTTTCPRCRRTTERSSLHPALKSSRGRDLCSDCYAPMELLAADQAQILFREHRLRSWAQKYGLDLKRSRRRADYGTYGLYHVNTGEVAIAHVESMDGYGLDLDIVEELLTERESNSSQLRVPLPDVVALQTHEPNLKGAGEIPLRRLVKEALRMRPSRIVVGEVRQEECLDLTQSS